MVDAALILGALVATITVVVSMRMIVHTRRHHYDEYISRKRRN